MFFKEYKNISQIILFQNYHQGYIIYIFYFHRDFFFKVLNSVIPNFIDTMANSLKEQT